MQLVSRQSTQIIQKQRIQIQHNRIKNPNWQEAATWLFPSVAKHYFELRNNWEQLEIQPVARAGLEPGNAYCESDALTTRPAWGGGWGVGVALFWSLPGQGYASTLGLVNQYPFPGKGLLLSQGSRGNGKLRCVDFFLFFEGEGVGSKRYVCMYAVAGEPSKEGVCYRAWEWSVWEWTPVLYSKVYFLTKVLHSCSHCKKRNSNTDDNQYLDEYSKPTIIWKCWLDNL